MKQQTLSVVIATKNEEQNIQACIESVKWADEIIIVDHYSTDKTVELARKYTKKIIYGDCGPLNLIEYNISLGIKNATKNWVLIVDADERVTAELKQEMQEILAQNKKVEAYRGHYTYYFIGKKLKSNYLNSLASVRLFKNGCAYYELTSNHKELIVKGKIDKFRNPFIHYWCSSYHDLLEKAHRYAKQDAHGIYFDNGKSLTKKQSANLYTLFFEPYLYFCYAFILKKEYKDGINGIIISVYLFYYLGLTYWSLLFLKIFRRKTKYFDKQCIVCQKNNWRRVIKGTVNKKEYSLFQCNNCDLGVINPMPKVEYCEYAIDFYINNQALFNVYMKEILDQVLQYKTKGDFLDIGANIGLLAKQAKDKGFKVEGVELSKAAIEYGRKTFNLKYYEKDIFSLNLKADTYDVVTMNHVLEHIEDPRKFLSEVHRILKPGGIMVVALPNFASISARVLKTKWASLQPQEHIWHFTPNSLAKLFQTQRFIIKQVVVSEPYREYKWRIRSILRLILYGPFYFFCRVIGSGRNLIIVVQKPPFNTITLKNA